MSPFQADLGWQPKSPLESFSSRADDRLQSVSEFRDSLEASLKTTTFSQRLAQAQQETYNSKKYTPPSYKVGDAIYLSKQLFTDSALAVRPSQKLSVRSIGPFRDTEIIRKMLFVLTCHLIYTYILSFTLNTRWNPMNSVRTSACSVHGEQSLKILVSV